MHQAPKPVNQLVAKARNKITLLLPFPTTTPTLTRKTNSMAVRMVPTTASPSHSSNTSLPSFNLHLDHPLPPPRQASNLAQLCSPDLTPTLLVCTSKEGTTITMDIILNNINTNILLVLAALPLLELLAQASAVVPSMARCTERALVSINTSTTNINISRVSKASWA